LTTELFLIFWCLPLPGRCSRYKTKQNKTKQNKADHDNDIVGLTSKVTTSEEGLGGSHLCCLFLALSKTNRVSSFYNSYIIIIIITPNPTTTTMFSRAKDTTTVICPTAWKTANIVTIFGCISIVASEKELRQ